MSSNRLVSVEKESHRIASKFLFYKKKRALIIPNGVPMLKELPPPSRSTREQTKFALYAGRIVPQKQLETLIISWDIDGSELDLIIVGSTSHSNDYYDKLLRLKGDNERIHFMGLLDRNELFELYRKCTILIHPSKNEGFSNTLLEALSHGCCIVSSDIKENKEVLGDAGIYFKTCDPRDLNNKVSYLISSNELIENQKRNLW